MKTPLPSYLMLLVLASSGIIHAQVPPQKRPPHPQPQEQQPSDQQTDNQRPSDRPRPSHRIPPPNRKAPRPGDSLPNLPANLRMAFADGLEEFTNQEDAEGGLGPIFNRASCVTCHFQGGIGGAGDVNVTRFGFLDATGFDPLAALGGSLLQELAIDPAAQEHVPAEANIVAQRQTTPLFGAGLIEAIPDETILAGVRDSKQDGVGGKACLVTDVVSGQTRVGRFGWKSQQATLLAFSADAYVNEMGITNRFFPEENAPNGSIELLAAYDNIADPEDTIDPETGKADIDHAADFMRFLAPLRPLPRNPSAKAGRNVFMATGCAVCHTPRLFTGRNSIAALNRKPVDLYSDLLLHDMGTLGDGIAQGEAGPTEMKTAPLWGLRASAPYLHDGSASTVDEAIREHDGEAATSRTRYEALGTIQRQQLLDFLHTSGAAGGMGRTGKDRKKPGRAGKQGIRRDPGDMVRFGHFEGDLRRLSKVWAPTPAAKPPGAPERPSAASRRPGLI